MGIDGSNFRVLHSFNGGTTEGFGPLGSLVLVGSTLYGMTSSGGVGVVPSTGGETPGSPGDGTIFQLLADGRDYRVLHFFAGGANDGSQPLADLTAVGSTLYGTTYSGGASNLGTVFSFTAPVPEPLTLALTAGAC
jgi:uncharacterized repeat protein (TIGR03803 family)